MSNIIDKIKKLLRLGESDNEHEAALAVGRAQALAEKHRIDIASLDPSEKPPEEDIDTWEDPLDTTRASWKGRLGRVLANANGCELFKSGERLVLVGRGSNAATVRYLYAYCSKEIDRLAGKKKGNGRTWLNNYRIGCVEAVNISIKEERAAVRRRAEAAASNESALVVVKDAIARVEAETNEVSIWAKRKHGLRSRRSQHNNHPGARQAGRADGAGIYPGKASGSVAAGHRRIES